MSAEIDNMIKNIYNDYKETESIKLCPFCGCRAKYMTDSKNDGNCHYEVGFVQCTNADCRSKSGEYGLDGYYGSRIYTKQEIINAWNKRLGEED